MHICAYINISILVRILLNTPNTFRLEIMKRIGIVACEIFEEELLKLLSEYNNIDRIILVSSDSSKEFQKMLESKYNYDKITIARELCSKRFLKREASLEVVINILPFALHLYAEDIKREVVNASKEIEKHVDYILLLYGLCGNALGSIKDLLFNNKIKVPFDILTNEKGEIMDDCICALIGSSENYLRELEQSTSIFFMTPGWAKLWPRLIEEKTRNVDSNKMEELSKMDVKEKFKMALGSSDYKKVIGIELDFIDKSNFRARCKEFASHFNSEVVIREGTIDSLKGSFEKALKELEKQN
ncbi:MAG: hypothetical protein APG12_00558 [Candidatus Methanofastidiosum methylothiophilum]|uniref:DUF1638 domain-containing protein n=1 Tax=Candidatus Methanofastidiosum methylothiophilum TaxID=1705564 RepID=A0A150J0J7_9EURY|nr:MAG: hypothetical protein APG10_00485 [Candidatus Methanofastidiosum methylthiophilus]KYC48379.1 MAG: hypothetical protein APG11_00392 [Candidatus Methanofastidiosum methylthiophilus]KYC50756.1 MAG: hypothetical protein APG12_00558 [Candidatus Methanofastidiosum methylthiophilus]